MHSATCIVKPGLIEDAIADGKLSLDGHIRPVRGVLPVALLCRCRGVPIGSAGDAADAVVPAPRGVIRADSARLTTD